ncbi:MAG: S8 family peptidase [Actinomycetes bacterium]
MYVEFESFPGIELALETLDPKRGKIRPELRSVRVVGDGDSARELAAVFVPEGGVAYFLRRIEVYLETADLELPGRRRTNRNFFDRIAEVRRATLSAFWTDPPEEFPTDASTVTWWEVWLRRRDNSETSRLRHVGEATGLRVSGHQLVLADRVVVLVAASVEQLAAGLPALDDLAELRRPHFLEQFLADLPALEQAEWIEDLVSRTTPALGSSPVVCLLDTGVDQGHPLLGQSLDLADCQTCEPGWGTGDHDGHGTQQAGLALYGDVGEALAATSNFELRTRLESVKILPPAGSNPEELYGAITADAVARAEIQHPDRRRVFSLAVTAVDVTASTDPVKLGEPTSWSAAIDGLAAGLSVTTDTTGLVVLSDVDLDSRRLFIVAAGNVRDHDVDHLARSDVEPCEDPSQAWNALTVGGYTALHHISPGTGFDGYRALAEPGELSPFSRTSVAFSRTWPIKPDVVFEAGSTAVSAVGDMIDTPPSLQLITTRRRTPPGSRLLTVANGTSPAAAQASHLAANILADYPSLWPETVRGLIVHSARWTDPMRRALSRARGRAAVLSLVRRYGMGVPDLTRAVRSATDALTLVVEDVIHPFDNGALREMHLHDLPWPVDALADLGATEVALRVTLSYYVEPAAARRGWSRRYRYASHLLRFDLRQPGETTDGFRKRLNDRALEEEERRVARGSDAEEWLLGPQSRTAGSLHHDVWTGTAADLADRGVLAVYPVSGWWKDSTSRDGSDRGAPYALVVSIEAPDVDVDLWTPVAQELGIPVPASRLAVEVETN